MDWFYNTSLTMRADSEILDADTGVYKPSKSYTTVSFKADVQPADNEKIYDESGKMIEYHYRVYCDKLSSMVSILKKPSAQIVYNSRFFSIEKITEWDDYYIFYIKAKG